MRSAPRRHKHRWLLSPDVRTLRQLPAAALAVTRAAALPSPYLATAALAASVASSALATAALTTTASLATSVSAALSPASFATAVPTANVVLQ